MLKEIVEKVKTKVRAKRKEKRLNKALSSPRSQLEFLRAGYSKFSAQLTERERAKMKKQIKSMERKVKAWEKANV